MFELGGVRKACGVNLVVAIIGLHQLKDERTYDRLEVIEPKGLEGAGEDFTGDGVPTEQCVHMATLQSFNLV